MDREEQAVHVVVVKASENCNLKPEMIDSFDPADDSLLKVILNIKDINDNPPTFDKSIVFVNLSTESIVLFIHAFLVQRYLREV